jgi:hypothetical protein
MHWSRILGIGLLVIGLLLLYMGWQSSQSLTEELHEGLTGRYTDGTMQLLVGGGASFAVGLALLMFGIRR